MRALLLSAILVTLTLSGCVDESDSSFETAPEMKMAKFGDVTVLAIVDSGFNPYHHDFRADLMPQHQDNDPNNDLPLHLPPHEWIPGFPDPETFASYTALDLTLSDDESAESAALYGEDDEEWSKVKTSGGSIEYTYIPDTKIIGYLNMGGGTGFSPGSHGVGTTSVSVGNIYGSCPECLLVFVNSFSSAANPWMSGQEWIDVQSNSWGSSTAYRDNIYSNCDTDALQAGVERGQQIFWSGGNGQANAFMAPVVTLYSCQKGPDYLVTVGAIDPDSEASYTGHGKPVDIAGFGRGYPAAGGTTVTDSRSFGGTSNAAPVNAGIFAKSLWTLRNEFQEARIQENGTIATGPALCGAANPDCAMADGQLTVHELREAYYRAATHTDAYFTDGQVGVPIPVGNEETEYFTEGHGSYKGKLGDLAGEIGAIVAEVKGDAFDEMSQAQKDFAIAYSYCSQQVWGEWDHGFWKPGDPVPTDPTKPLQTFMATECPTVINAILTVS